MAYEKNVWNTGDLISSEKMNHIEKGIADIESNITAQATTAAQNVVKGNIVPRTVDTGKITFTDLPVMPTPHQIRSIKRSQYFDPQTNQNYPNSLCFYADAFEFGRGYTKESLEPQEAAEGGVAAEGGAVAAVEPAPLYGITLYELKDLFRLAPYVNKLISLANSSSSGSGSGGTVEPPAEVEVDPEPGTGGNSGSEAGDDPADSGAEVAVDDPNAEDPDPNAVPAEVEVEAPANP